MLLLLLCLPLSLPVPRIALVLLGPEPQFGPFVPGFLERVITVFLAIGADPHFHLFAQVACAANEVAQMSLTRGVWLDDQAQAMAIAVGALLLWPKGLDLGVR